jgi:hypothetical protein
MTNGNPALPSDYLQWLRKLPELHVVRFQKNEWQFWTEEELQETTRVNKITSTHIGMMVGFVAMYRAMGLAAAKGQRRFSDCESRRGIFSLEILSGLFEVRRSQSRCPDADGVYGEGRH